LFCVFFLLLSFLWKNLTMAYDADLAQRISALLKNKKNFTRKEMFGGVGYLLNGNMCVGVHKHDLIVRFNPQQTDEFMKKQRVKPFDITGRPMKGWLLVEGGASGKELAEWLDIATSFVKSLPQKK